MERTRTLLDDFNIFALMANALALRPLGHDPVERGDRAASVSAPEPAPPRRRLLDRLDDWFWKHEQREREAYLAASTDIYDLEARMRNLERGTLHRGF